MCSIATTSKASSGDFETKRFQATLIGKTKHPQDTQSAHNSEGVPLRMRTSSRARMLFKKSRANLKLKPNPHATQKARRDFFSWDSLLYTTVCIVVMAPFLLACFTEDDLSSRRRMAGGKRKGGKKPKAKTKTKQRSLKVPETPAACWRSIQPQESDFKKGKYFVSLKQNVNFGTGSKATDKLGQRKRKWQNNIVKFFKTGTINHGETRPWNSDWKTEAEKVSMTLDKFTPTTERTTKPGKGNKVETYSFNFEALREEITSIGINAGENFKKWAGTRNKITRDDINFWASLIEINHRVEAHQCNVSGIQSGYQQIVAKYGVFLFHLLEKSGSFGIKSLKERTNRVKLVQCLLGEEIIVWGEKRKSTWPASLKATVKKQNREKEQRDAEALTDDTDTASTSDTDEKDPVVELIHSGLGSIANASGEDRIVMVPGNPDGTTWFNDTNRGRENLFWARSACGDLEIKVRMIEEGQEDQVQQAKREGGNVCVIRVHPRSDIAKQLQMRNCKLNEITHLEGSWHTNEDGKKQFIFQNLYPDNGTEFNGMGMRCEETFIEVRELDQPWDTNCPCLSPDW